MHPRRILWAGSFVSISGSLDNRQVLRRGRRYRYAPLEWWRLERVIYGNDYDKGQDNDEEDEGDKPVTLVPSIKAILREPVEPFLKKHKRRWGSVTVDSESLPFPEADETRIPKPLGKFWITPPTKRSDGESRLQHRYLENYPRRRRIVHSRLSSAMGITSLPDTSSWNLRRRNRMGVRRIIHVCSSLPMTFGRSATRGRADISRCSGCNPRQGQYNRFHGPSRMMFLGPP